jgi:hypothetical protein
MAFQPGANLYTQGFGSRPENVEVPHIEARDPSATDINYPIGKRWLNTASQEEFILYKFQAVGGITQAVWGTPVGATGALISISDTTNVKTFPNADGNIQLTGAANQISVTSNPGANSIQLGATNPFNIQGLTATGVVSLANSTNSAVNIGNSASSGVQIVNINSGGRVNVGEDGVGEVFIGNSNNLTTVNSPLNCSRGVTVQGSLSNTSGGLILIDNTLSNFTSVILGSGVYNTIGSEGAIECTSSGAVTINLTTAYTPGAYIFIFNSTGTAAANNITINAPGGGFILEDSQAPAASYVINTNYGNVEFYRIPNTSNFLVINH